MFYKYRNKKVLPCSSADEEALNTKTKLDLTKLFYSWNFTIPFLFGANVRINHILTNYNRQNSLFYR